MTPIEHQSIFGDTYEGVPNPVVPHAHPYPTRFHGRMPSATTMRFGTPYQQQTYVGFGSILPNATCWDPNSTWWSGFGCSCKDGYEPGPDNKCVPVSASTPSTWTGGAVTACPAGQTRYSSDKGTICCKAGEEMRDTSQGPVCVVPGGALPGATKPAGGGTSSGQPAATVTTSSTTGGSSNTLLYVGAAAAFAALVYFGTKKPTRAKANKRRRHA